MSPAGSISLAHQGSCLHGLVRNDIEHVKEAMFRALRAVTKSNWVSWCVLWGAVCKVAPPELLDYCLKKLGGKLMSDGVVVQVLMQS